MNDIPDAQTPHESGDDSEAMPSLADMPPLVIGQPFAIAYGLELLDRAEQEPGCVAIVRCQGPDERGCGQLFRINLLDGDVKSCPRCSMAYTHMLLVAPVEDDEVIRDAMVQVLLNNGIQLADPDGDDGQVDDSDEGERT